MADSSTCAVTVNCVTVHRKKEVPLPMNSSLCARISQATNTVYKSKLPQTLLLLPKTSLVLGYLLIETLSYGDPVPDCFSLCKLEPIQYLSQKV